MSLGQFIPAGLSPIRRATYIAKQRGVLVPKTFPRRATYRLAIHVLCDASPRFPLGIATSVIPVQFEGREAKLSAVRSVVDTELVAMGIDRCDILSVRILIVSDLTGKAVFDGFAYASTPQDAYDERQSMLDHSAAICDMVA